MLPLTHLLLAAGVAAMLTVLLRSYREQPSQQLRLRIAAFAALGVFGVAALVLYGLLHIYWYDATFSLQCCCSSSCSSVSCSDRATEDMRFHMEHRISHQMQREDRMTGLPNRRAFEEYMERIRTGEVGCPRCGADLYPAGGPERAQRPPRPSGRGMRRSSPPHGALQTSAARARTEAKAYRASAPAETSSPSSVPSQGQIRGSCTGSSARLSRGTTAPVRRAPASR